MAGCLTSPLPTQQGCLDTGSAEWSYFSKKLLGTGMLNVFLKHPYNPHSVVTTHFALGNLYIFSI